MVGAGSFHFLRVYGQIYFMLNVTRAFYEHYLKRSLCLPPFSNNYSFNFLTFIYLTRYSHWFIGMTNKSDDEFGEIDSREAPSDSETEEDTKGSEEDECSDEDEESGKDEQSN
jgi:hypothetical protein